MDNKQVTTRAILFDLDGTLLDTLDDIADACNAVLAAENCPTYETAAYRRFVGDGVRMLFRRTLPESCRDDGTLDRCVAGFGETYGRSWNVKSRPYDGIPELLDALAERGLPASVLSNKPHSFTRQCVDEFLAAWQFAAVFGQRESVPPKPDPSGALEIAAMLGFPPNQFLYVGDTNTDMRTATAAGMRAVGVTWGFRSAEELREAGADVLIDRPADLLRLCEQSAD